MYIIQSVKGKAAWDILFIYGRLRQQAVVPIIVCVTSLNFSFHMHCIQIGNTYLPLTSNNSSGIFEKGLEGLYGSTFNHW